jgi:hypothetical protein
MAGRVLAFLMAATIVSEQVPTRTDPRDCDHLELAYLGAGGGISYYRCRGCGKAVIEERGRRWMIRGPRDEPLSR